MARTMNVVGVFRDSLHLDAAMRDLEADDFDRNHMRIVDSTRYEGEALWDEITDLGVPHDDARFYRQQVQSGSALLVLETAEDRCDRAIAVIGRHETVAWPDEDTTVLASTADGDERVAAAGGITRSGARRYPRH